MSNTAVVLTKVQGVLKPSVPSVPIAIGDTVSFSTSDGSAAFLFFSPAATAALSPAPTMPFALDGSAEFTFTSAAEGAYSVFFETSASATPPQFPQAPSPALLLEIDLTVFGFGSPDDRIKR